MKRILVIDDEPDVADLLAVTLRKHGGFSVSGPCDATAGLRKAREESPLLILLDLMLPAMSGFQVCRLLKRDSATAKIPIIILTARADEVDRILGFELGAAITSQNHLVHTKSHCASERSQGAMKTGSGNRNSRRTKSASIGRATRFQ